MNPITALCLYLAIVASAYGGSFRVPRQGWGWGPSSPASITANGGADAIGIGASVAEQNTHITVNGSQEVPALLSISVGTGVNLNQLSSNYQQTLINQDGSSAAYQANTASNGGDALNYLGGDAQGLNVDVQTNGWSAVEGVGAVEQVDTINHEGPGETGSGRLKPVKP